MSILDAMRVCCVTMQRDEETLLQPWISYHGNLFGHHNLIVLDNGSSLKAVRTTLKNAERKGVEIISAPGKQAYMNKHYAFAEAVRARVGRYEFVMPLDIDEFVIAATKRGFTTDKVAIKSALARHLSSTAPLRTRHQLANHPALPDRYYWFHMHKCFFAAGSFAEIDHGSHNGKSLSGEPQVTTDICHIHMHNWPWKEMLERTRRKWNSPLSIEDTLASIKKGAEFAGNCGHLLHLFEGDEWDWYQRIERNPVWEFPQFRARLATLGPHLAIPLGGPVVPPIQPLQDAGAAQVTPMWMPHLFDVDAYAKRYPDVHHIGPLEHFVLYGRAEGRQVETLPE